MWTRRPRRRRRASIPESNSLKYNSNPSTLGPNDSQSQYGLSNRTDSRIRSRVDSLNYNTNPSQFRIVDPRFNVQRF